MWGSQRILEKMIQKRIEAPRKRGGHGHHEHHEHEEGESGCVAVMQNLYEMGSEHVNAHFKVGFKNFLDICWILLLLNFILGWLSVVVNFHTQLLNYSEYLIIYRIMQKLMIMIECGFLIGKIEYRFFDNVVLSCYYR